MPGFDKPAARHEREAYPVLIDVIGEDPARFLDRPLLGADETVTGGGTFIGARVKGIDEIEVVRAWKAIERRLDRGPREQVLDLLDHREEELEEIGERPDRLNHGSRTPTAVEKTVRFVDEDGEPYERRENSMNGSMLDYRDAESSETAVATDGGETDT